ncbi:MAG TPA: helix-turn-helix domain-containing protein [Limnobacter sp.]|nr:helix-turn-helix domain-containing protein [Limnobacter sp.]
MRADSWQYFGMNNPSIHSQAGSRIRELRLSQKRSQLELAMQVGMSQRHLSFMETGKANGSREMLLALMDALDAPLAQRNEVLVAAGYAPLFDNRPLDHADMGPVNHILDVLLNSAPAVPAMLLDSQWNLVKVNPAFLKLLQLLQFDLEAVQQPVNLLQAMMAEGGLAARLINRDEVLSEILRRAQREAVNVPALCSVLSGLPRLQLKALKHGYPQRPPGPTLVTRFNSTAGALQFISTFTTFGAPVDITAASLRIEHLFPADDFTRSVLS